MAKNVLKLQKWERAEDLRKGFVTQAWSLCLFGFVNGVLAFLAKNYVLMVINVFPILLGVKIVNSNSRWKKYKENEDMEKVVEKQVKEGNIK